MRQANLGKHLTEEHKRKISVALQGNKNDLGAKNKIGPISNEISEIEMALAS